MREPLFICKRCKLAFMNADQISQHQYHMHSKIYQEMINEQTRIQEIHNG